VNELRKRFSPLPPNTTSTCFQLLFPEEDVHRKYDIQETRMAQLLADCFGIENETFESWSLEEATGCLGQELKVVLERSCSVSNTPLTRYRLLIKCLTVPRMLP
jgi:DNA ligase-4